MATFPEISGILYRPSSVSGAILGTLGLLLLFLQVWRASLRTPRTDGGYSLGQSMGLLATELAQS